MRVPYWIRWIVGAGLVGLVAGTLGGTWSGSLPHVTITPEIRDVAMEMRRTIIQLDGVLIGFAGLIGTMIFTRPIARRKERKEVLRATLLMVLASVCCLIVSVFLAMYSLSYTFSQSAILVDLPFVMSAWFLVAGVAALGSIIVVEVYPPPLG